MDPNATYDALDSALRESRWSEATEHARALWNWLANGGFAPARPELAGYALTRMPPQHRAYLAPGLSHLVNGINRKLRGEKES